MRKYIIGLVFLFTFVNTNFVKAQEFFDKSDAVNFFTFGARLGVNTSNRTFPAGNYSNMILTSWGTGFEIGAVADINFKEYLSLQPGLFFESRSGNIVNIVDYYSDMGNAQTYYEKDHLRAFYFTIPVMGVVKFNITDKLKWMVDLGPYFQLKISESGQNDVKILYRPANSTAYTQYSAKHNSIDAGIKVGTGLRIYNHYYIGVHYLAGFCNAWKEPLGGRNKSWDFTIGYDF